MFLKKMVRLLYERVLLFAYDGFYGLHLRYQRIRLKRNINIKLGRNVKIRPDAKVETRHGGQISIGDGTEIMDGVLLFSYKGRIEIGRCCSINYYSVIYGHFGARIGNNVLIAGHCMIIPSNHVFSEADKLIMEQGSAGEGIVIEDDVWIGHGCTILDGVTVGKGAVVAAGSVVAKSVAPYSVVGGVPARFIKMRGK